MPEPVENTIRVWDPLVRIGHWTLVGTFAVAYLLGDDILVLHVWAGYLLGIVVVARVAWGFVGSRHARFTDFVCGPRKAIGYLRDLLTLRSRRFLGHSPAGGAMVIVLIVMLGATVYSGLMVYALEDNSGPLAFLAERSASSEILANNKGRADFWEEAHEVLANATLILVILHIVGVIFASFVHRENLVRAMITGDKRAEPEA